MLTMTPEIANNKKFVDDKECIAQWKDLIGKFNKLVENAPPPESIRKELLDIKEKSNNAHALTFRQNDALCARVDNYLANKYGHTKTLSQMSQSKSGINK